MKRILVGGMLLTLVGCAPPHPPVASPFPTATLPPQINGSGAPLTPQATVAPSEWREHRLKNVSIDLPGEVDATTDALKALTGPDYHISVMVLDGFERYKDISDEQLTKAILAKAQSNKMVGQYSTDKFKEFNALRYSIETPKKELQENLHFVTAGRFYTIAFSWPTGSPPMKPEDEKRVLDSFKIVEEAPPIVATPAPVLTPTPAAADLPVASPTPPQEP